VLGNDTISLLGAGKEGLNLKWSKHNHYGIEIEVPDHALDKVEHAWAFQVKYNISGYWDGPTVPYKP